MLDITFITSNTTKLAHARYLSTGYDISVLHYKKKYYGIGYIEPRILDKMRLLEESMNDAIDRWKKNVSNNKTQLFFIEDTSVKIDALSSEDNEVPGADIKYWMLKNSFYDIDNELKKRENNRKASVTSHIVLFLTDEIKKIGMINDDYIIFKSTSYGKIVEKDYLFETQILYPWLDNKTFNKWFVPDGYDLPISMLDISDADKADFRKGAFEDMLKFIGKYYDINPLLNKTKLMNSEYLLPFTPLYLISGPTCAGKSTIGKYLLEMYGYYHIEASDFMSLKYYETHGTDSTIDKHFFASELLKINPLVVVESIIKYLQSKKRNNRVIVTGFRTSNEVNNFCNILSNQDIRKIYITADPDIRFSRWQKRNRDITNYTKERFLKINELQNGIGLPKIKEINDIILFENNKDGFEILYSEFQTKIIGDDIIQDGKRDISNLTNIISLEKAILAALAIEYIKTENEYYTTTEISHLINKNLTGINKNKNNVSRYFNQSYYPYYEIKTDKNKRRYKLSPTGYSEAKFIAQNMQRIN